MKKRNSKRIFAGISSAVILASLPVFTGIQAADVVYGDANCDGVVTMADAVAILQNLSNSNKYPLTAEGMDNADVNLRGDGLSAMDALSIQKYDAGVLKTLPESWLEGTGPVVADGTKIHLDGTKITVEGENASVEGSVVTITHSGEYYVDGTLDDGQINVNIADETADAETVKIYLNGVNITGKTAPAIYVTNAENTSINIVDGTENTLSDGETAYTDGSAVIYAKDDITIKGGEQGTGVLNVVANINKGIECNNDIKFNGGTVDIDALNTTDKNDGVSGKKSVTVKSGTVKVKAEGDGIKSSKGNVEISGGTVKVKAGNDAVQASTSIDISGGNVTAGGDRGFRLDAEGKLNITGGTVIATATDYQVDGNEAIDLSGITQDTILLDMAEEQAKGTTFERGDIFESNKKFSYALISSAKITEVNTAAIIIKNGDVVGNAVDENGSVAFGLNENNIGRYKGVKVKTSGNTDSSATEEANTLTLSGTSILSSAPTDAVTVSNGTATITKPGSYDITGEAKDVQIVVDVDSKTYPDGVVELNLKGATISNSKTAPIYVASIGDEVQIIAKAGTENVISDGTEHTQTYKDSDGNENTVEGAIFARDDIKFKGAGKLTVNGNTDDAIVCKNDIKIFNGELIVNAKDDGIRGKDSVTIGKTVEIKQSEGGSLIGMGNETPSDDYANLKVTVKTESGDGIKSTATDTGTDKSYGIVTINGGTVDIKSYADGIQAEQEFIMNGGDVNIYTYEGSAWTANGTAQGGSSTTNPWGGGRPGGGGMGMDGNANKVDISAKGIKAVGLYDAAGTTYQSMGNIIINGGTLVIDSSDDAVHCSGVLSANGGVLTLSSADDALHSDRTLNIGKTAGDIFDDITIYVPKCYEGVEAETINQNSGSVYIVSDDDGYNAAGGKDGSGNTNQGGFGGGFGSSSSGTMNLNGGFVVVNSASGDHDAFDSNGGITINGGYYCANGQEPMDCDGTLSNVGGNYISMTAGNTNLSTRYTIADANGKVIVSFISASGSAGKAFTNSNLKAYTGGTVTGGTQILTNCKYETYIGGTISGGTEITSTSSSGGGMQRPW